MNDPALGLEVAVDPQAGSDRIGEPGTGLFPPGRRQPPLVEVLAQATRDVPTDAVQGYAPKGTYAWDFWITKLPLGGQLMLHLSAPDNGNPDSRHVVAQVRAALSHDLFHWRDAGVVLAPRPDHFDQDAIWTGSSLVRPDGKVHVFYTGMRMETHEGRRVPVQSIGAAILTPDVRTGKFTVQRGETPILQPDPRIYESPTGTAGARVIPAWRDPSVTWQASRGEFAMVIAARTKDGDLDHRSAIALATAGSLDGPWQVHPPLVATAWAKMEVPQLIERNGRHYLFANVRSLVDGVSSSSVNMGLVCYVSDDLEGPYLPIDGADGVIVSPEHNLFCMKLVDDPERDGELVLMGFYEENRTVESEGRLLMERAMTVSAGFPVQWQGDQLTVDFTPTAQGGGGR